jgi:hypothetical protein
MGKYCQWQGGCLRDRVPTERFCALHRKIMLRRMEDEGYLQPLPPKDAERGDGQTENVHETKFGIDE